MTQDMTSFDAALKDHYKDQRVENMVYKNNPFMALVPKKEDFGGRKWPCPIIYGNPQGRSKTFSTAQTRGGSSESKIESFDLTRVKDYGVATIDGETMEASKGDINAFMDAATTEIDGIIREVTHSIAFNLYRDSSAYRGQVNAEPTEEADFTITLKNTNDVVGFEVGQQCVIYSAKSGGSQRISESGTNTFTVIAVDRQAGTVQFDETYDSNGTIAANDYIFINGDRGNGISGLEDWLPSSAPGATAFFGVARNVDPTRLGGQRLDGSSMPIEEALIEGDSVVSREGGALTHYFMNQIKFRQLKKSLGSKVQYVDQKTAYANVSFKGVMIEGDKGPITVLPDHNCPSDRVFGVDMSTWTLATLGKAVRVLNGDGLQMLRQASSDGYEVRYGFYGQLGCKAPGWNINIQV